MKATKKIVGAACALVAAVALSAGSTFAWFSNSGKVTATGMNVKAKTSEALVISNSNSDTAEWGITAASSDEDTTELTPASTTTGKVFFGADENTLDTVDYQTGAASEATNFVDAVIGTHYVEHTYYIKAVAPADATDPVTYDTLYVSAITVKSKGEKLDGATKEDENPGTTEKISKSLRISVQWGETGTAYIYAPLGGSNSIGIAKTGLFTAEGVQDAVTINTAGLPATDITGTGNVSSEEATKVIIRIWYEGQDSNCTSFNAMSVQELEVSVDFAAANND